MTAKRADPAVRCPEKAVYDTWEAAEAAALLLMDDIRDGKPHLLKRGNVTAYRCRICQRWHIGHVSKPKSPSRLYA